MRRRAQLTDFSIPDLAAAFAESAPGGQREWFSYGTVRGRQGDDADPCVEWVDDQPLVSVLLHPSLVECRARVAMDVAGDGEASWHPFVPGDEVVCALPDGDPRGGVVILGKLTNAIDKFPAGSVAGQDPRKNAFSFRRSRTPHVEEFAGPVMLRSASTGGFISIDDAGMLTLRGGNPGDPEAKTAAPGFQMGPDAVGFQTDDAKFALQLNKTEGVFLVLADDAVLSLASSSSSKPSMIGVPGALAIGTAGNPTLEHVATTESVANLLFYGFTSLAAAFSAAGAAPQTGLTIATIIEGWLTAGLPLIIPAAAGGPLPAQILTAIITAFAAATQKPNSVAGQASPGIGCPGLLVG